LGKAAVVLKGETY